MEKNVFPKTEGIAGFTVYLKIAFGTRELVVMFFDCSLVLFIYFLTDNLLANTQIFS